MSQSRFRSGGKAIAEYLGRSVAATFHALDRRQIPGAAKHGGTWVLDTVLFEDAHRAKAEERHPVAA